MNNWTRPKCCKAQLSVTVLRINVPELEEMQVKVEKLQTDNVHERFHSYFALNRLSPHLVVHYSRRHGRWFALLYTNHITVTRHNQDHRYDSFLLIYAVLFLSGYNRITVRISKPVGLYITAVVKSHKYAQENSMTKTQNAGSESICATAHAHHFSVYPSSNE